MFVLIVDFIKPVEEVTPQVEPHSAWVKKHFEEGLFLLAGPKKSKLGGALLVKSMDKKKLMKILAEDPYISEDVAEYRIVDFDCKATIKELDFLKGL
jgi:uncharacterized protein YciI